VQLGSKGTGHPNCGAMLLPRGLDGVASYRQAASMCLQNVSNMCPGQKFPSTFIRVWISRLLMAPVGLRPVGRSPGTRVWGEASGAGAPPVPHNPPTPSITHRP
jgi:hypothetical protein